MDKMPFLAGELANIYILTHYKRLRETVAQATEKDYSLLLRCTISYRHFEVWILVGQIGLLLRKEGCKVLLYDS